MRRRIIDPRPDWKAKVEQIGLFYHQNRDGDYWNEAAYYEFTEAEVDLLETATNELHGMCLQAVDYVVENRLWTPFAIPANIGEFIERSWRKKEPHLYGRFDFSFNGADPPKMLEYNADTPTVLLESAVAQWHWLQEFRPSADQFNSIWEGLVERWAELRSTNRLKPGIVHFASADSVEDFMTITTLQDTAEESGLETESLLVEDIGWDSYAQRFVDAQDRPISNMFKLYPWEWIVNEPFGAHLLERYEETTWIEPIWKMILSNKALLPILWRLFPDGPYLLETHFEGPETMSEYVKKPILGREGSNVTIVSQSGQTQNDGEYGAEGFVYQRYAPLPTFDGRHPVIGSWIIGDESRGIGIRESAGPITTDLSSFTPHLFE